MSASTCVFLHLWIPWHWDEPGVGEDIAFEGLSDNEGFLFVTGQPGSLSALKFDFLIPWVAVFQEIFEALLEGLRFSVCSDECDLRNIIWNVLCDSERIFRHVRIQT